MGLIAAELESRGMATVILSCLDEVTERVRPPRWLSVPYALGFPLGEPGNAPLQRKILEAALDLLTREGAAPVWGDFPGA